LSQPPPQSPTSTPLSQVNGYRETQRVPAPRGQRRAQTGSMPSLDARRPIGVRHGVGLTTLLALIVAAGAGAFKRPWMFIDWGSGVLALVALSGTVMWGLAATDRIFLKSNHRLLAQGVHRGLAVGGMICLGLHICAKVMAGQATMMAAAVPFVDPSRPVLVGLGTLAAYLFAIVAITGAVRSVFASSRMKSRMWRALHMCAYPAWGAAIVHGLKVGREVSGWVTASYVVCLAGAVVALMVRVLAGSPGSSNTRG
jgi:DMSO/TMAO reductase YedYZ heme-binding membrane subunit